jgi:hypothetical protein
MAQDSVTCPVSFDVNRSLRGKSESEGVNAMRGRIRIATAVAALAIMATAAMSSSVGAATPTVNPYTVSANGGFISLSLLNLIGLTGGGSSAGATNTASGTDVTASGTGLCATLSESATTCPTTTNANSADVINTTANATEDSAGASDNPAAACLVPPLSLVLVSLEAACGTASASQDASGDPTANGEGSLAQLTVGLGSLPGLGDITDLTNGGLGLCPSSAAGTDATTNPAGVATGALGGLLSSVQSLLSSANLPLLSGVTTTLCGILNGLTSELGGLGGILGGINASTNLLSVKIGDSTSAVTNTTNSAGDNVVTSTATTEGVEVNVLGLLDVQVLPNTASISIDTNTGIVSDPSATVGVLSLAQGSSAPTGISLPDLSSVISNLLNTLGLSGLIDPTLTTVAESQTSVAPNGLSGSAEAADLKLDLLGGLVVLNLGDAKVAASSSAAAPVVSAAVLPTTAASVTPAAPVAPAAVVPGVTTVHTGEFWAGPLPIVLVAGMALAGMMLIARRRISSVARSLVPFARHSTFGSAGGPPAGPASGTSSVPPPVSGPARRQSL